MRSVPIRLFLFFQICQVTLQFFHKPWQQQKYLVGLHEAYPWLEITATKQHSQMWEEQSEEESDVWGWQEEAESCFQIYRPSCWMLLSERERVAARGLINTESTASSEWVILIQRHYHPAITLPIQPETSSAELLHLFFPPWIIWGHDFLLTPSECRSTFSA